MAHYHRLQCLNNQTQHQPSSTGDKRVPCNTQPSLETTRNYCASGEGALFNLCVFPYTYKVKDTSYIMYVSSTAECKRLESSKIVTVITLTPEN